MSGFSNYLEAAIVNATLRSVAFPAAPTPYLALFTADPTDSGSLTNECNYTGYARLSTAGNWDAPSGSDNQTANTAQIVFAANSGATSPVITHFGIFDALTGGNMLYSGPLTASKTIAPGDQPAFGAGTLIVKPDTV